MQITRTMIRDWGACYPDDRISELVPLSGLTPIEVLDLDIPAIDRLWVVSRDSVIPARELRLLACKWARESMAVAGNPDPRSVAAVDTAERFARDEANEVDLDAARNAARNAASAAARNAAWNAQITDCKATLVALENK